MAPDCMEIDRYERGIEVYADQFGIEPDDVARWLDSGVGARFRRRAAALLGVYAGYPRASTGLMIIRDELARSATA